MSSISFTTDKKLKKLKGKFNPHDYEFVLVSDDVHSRKKSKKEETNISDASTLKPPSEILSQIINNHIDTFVDHYTQFLDIERADIIAVLIEAALNKKMDVVLVCSDDEYTNYLYMEVIAQYIEATYEGLIVFEFHKKLKKDLSYDEGKYKLSEKRRNKLIEQANEIAAHTKRSNASYKKKNKKKKKSNFEEKYEGFEDWGVPKKKDKKKKKKKKKNNAW